VTQYRPYDNELQLAYPAKITHFPADQVRREDNRLIVSFQSVGYEAAIEFKITDAYIAFRLESLTYNGYTKLRPKGKTPIDETLFVQLPIRDRKNLGEWLNVMWDEEIAVNVLATNPYTQIDAKARRGYHLFQAGTVSEVLLEGGGRSFNNHDDATTVGSDCPCGRRTSTCPEVSRAAAAKNPGIPTIRHFR